MWDNLDSASLIVKGILHFFSFGSVGKFYFQETWPMYMFKFINLNFFTISSFDVDCRICNDVYFFISDTGYLWLLSFFLDQSDKKFVSFIILFQELIIGYTDIYFLFLYFLCSFQCLHDISCFSSFSFPSACKLCFRFIFHKHHIIKIFTKIWV